MGLLTNPTTDGSNKLAILLTKYTGRLSLLSYIAGIAWIVFLANAEYNLGTYFSENALLPGLVVENFYDSHKAEDYVQFFMNKEEKEGRLLPEDFVDVFKKISVNEIETQNFTIRDPLTKTVTHGTNVYAVMRAKRASGTESIIFNVPYFPNNSKQGRNIAGISLMLALAEYFNDQVYWAKDIVFLVAEGHVGSLAWVKGHQEINFKNQVVEFDRVRNKVGNIQAAVNFILERNKVCSMTTKFHGINGQLPNLDLVNLLNKFVITEAEKRANWEADFWKLLDYMQIHAKGSPTGSHGYFLKYGIESVTLYGKSGKNCRHIYSYGDIGRNLEATFRSLNNLLERLHQSFFFYLKTTPNRFISIGLYFPPLALILFPILLKGASVWLTQPNLEVTKPLFILIAIHSIAVALRWSLSNLHIFLSSDITSNLTQENFKQIVLGVCAVQFVITKLLVRNSSLNLINCLYCFALLQVATALYCLALFNPSLVFIIGVIFAPLFSLLFFFNPGQTQKFSYVLLIALSILLSYTYNSLTPIIYKYFHEAETFGNFLFDFVSICLLPLTFLVISIV